MSKNIKKNNDKIMIKNLKQKKSDVGFFLVLFAVLLGATMIALMFGSAKLGLSDCMEGLLYGGDSVTGIIMRHVRLPRMLAGLLAGIGLAISGSLLQNVTENQMASPNIIGVNAGAGFVMILLLYIAPTAMIWLPLGAFFGAFLTTLLIVWTANRMGTSKVTIILAGLVFTTLLNAGISFVSLLDVDVLATYNHFSVGSLAGIDISRLILPALLILLSGSVSLLFSRQIKMLCLGDEMATSLGINVKKMRMICLICASASAAAVVSFAGLLGFVGLIVPHIARRFSGGDMKKELLSSVFIGGSLVLVADTLGRVVFAPTEIPVGIVMALIGAPFFLFLLLRRGEGA